MTTSLENTKPIEFFQEHAAEVVGNLAESGEPCVITVDGRPKAVIVNFDDYEEYAEIRKGIALSDILEKRFEQRYEGKSYSVDEVFDRIEQKLLERNR